jgi:hypothetical protein
MNCREYLTLLVPGRTVSIKKLCIPLETTIIITSLPNYKTVTTHLTLCSTALLEELIIAQLGKKYPTFYGSRSFITVFKSTTEPYPEPDESSPYPHTPFL